MDVVMNRLLPKYWAYQRLSILPIAVRVVRVDILIVMHLASTCVDRVAHLLRCLSLADHVLA